jgi:uncharacterized membrane protein YedE/YeeE
VKQAAVAFAAGIVFAFGLGISGMTDPAKIIAFLDVTGAWDPSLAFVMAGAVGVHAVAAWIARRRARPILADRFDLPIARGIDARLVGGAALFGLGWGAAGYCPGPAIVVAVGLGAAPLAFFAAMVAGVALHRWAPSRRATRSDG